MVGLVVLVLLAAALACSWLVDADRAAQQRAATAADDLATAAAAAVDTWTRLEATRLATVAQTQLRGPLSDAALSAAVAPLDKPFALVLDPTTPAVLAAHPPRDLDAAGLFADHRHLRQAADGHVGTRAIASGDGRHGIAIAVPFTDETGRPRVLSSVGWIETAGPGDVGAGLGSQLAALAVVDRAHVEVRDDLGTVVLRPTAGPPPDGPTSTATATSGHVVVATVEEAGAGGVPLWSSLVLVFGGAVVVAGAVGQIARAAGAAERAQREAAGLASMRADFVAIVSHEIRTPIVIIKGMLDTALGNGVDVGEHTRHDLLTRAHRAAARLDRLTSDILTSTLAEQGRIEPTPRDVLVTDLLAESVLNSKLAEDPRLVVECPGDLRVTTDAGLATHVIANLVDNAAKYGEPPVVVRARTRPGAIDVTRPASVDIEVVDHGVGLADEAVAFAAYGQGGSVLTRRNGGIGLGLHLARTIAGSLQGELTYARDGGLTVFRLTLPSQVSTAPADVAAAELAR